MNLKKIIERLRKFAAEQGGMEALQTVLIVAIAALLLFAAAQAASDGKDKMESGFDQVIEQIDEMDEEGGGSDEDDDDDDFEEGFENEDEDFDEDED